MCLLEEYRQVWMQGKGIYIIMVHEFTFMDLHYLIDSWFPEVYVLEFFCNDLFAECIVPLTCFGSTGI